MKSVDIKLKEFLKENMYNHGRVLKSGHVGKKIIKELFCYLVKNPNKYIKKESFKNKKKERAISDFIAGMTDRYAINLYKSIK